jgi:Flp pilus assembly protein TadD
MVTASSNEIMKRTVLSISLILLFVSCATTGGKKFRGMFKEDIAQNRESVMVGGSKQAVNDLSMILEMDPKNDEARFLRAVAYQKMGEHPKAVEDYSAILKRNPGHSKAHFNLGMIYAYKMNDPSAALKHLDRFISIAPDDPRAGQAAKIMLSLDIHAASAPSNINGMIEEVLAQRGAIRAESKQGSETRIRTLKNYIRAAPDSPQLHFALGKSYENDGKYSEAIRSYEKALELSPTYAICHSHLGKLLAKLGKNDEAEIHAVKASLFRKTTVDDPPTSQARASAGPAGPSGALQNPDGP